jgi:hypothetical protein
MDRSPEPHPRQRRYSLRRQARLDTEAQATLEELPHNFHRTRAAILHYVMDWGATHTTIWPIDPAIPDRPHLVHLLVGPERLRQVQAAAEAHGGTMAARVRQAMRQVTLDDFPPSWRAGPTARRAHDSSSYGTRVMLRLDHETLLKLAAHMQTFDRSAAESMRQPIAQARSEDFPADCHLSVTNRRPREARRPHEHEPRVTWVHPRRSCRLVLSRLGRPGVSHTQTARL